MKRMLSIVASGFLLFATASRGDAASAPTPIDHLRFGDAAGQQAHAVAVAGSVSSGVITARVGTLSLACPALIVSGKGSAVSFAMAVTGSGGDRPLLLEVQEVHDRRCEVFGYTVLVNGREAYFRTYEEMGAGPNHYFIQVERAHAPDGRVQVTLRNEGDSTFAIGQAWLYDDFFGLAEADGTPRKMIFSDNPQVLLGEPKYHPTQHVGITSAEYEDRLWNMMQERFAGTPFIPGTAGAVLHGFRSSPESRRRVDEDLDRAIRHGLPLQLAFMAGEWGVHPTGMDGLGGYFGDVIYSQIIYDPVAKSYRPTWPDTPGGTTWPTWNNPQLQAFLAYRLERAAGYYADQRAFRAAKGLALPPALVCHDWGLSIGPFADCNDGTVADAARDGIALTPEDGLDAGEKAWIYQNLARVPARTAAVYRRAVGRDAVVVDRGEIRRPSELLRDQNYFHTFYPAVHPYYDHRYAGWQTGVGPEVWTTGETSPNLPYAYYDYVIALGKLVTVNLERGFFRDNLDFIFDLYELGFQWVTPCNTRPGDADLFLPKAKGLDERAALPALPAERKLLDIQFMRDEQIGPEDRVVSVDNMTLQGNPRKPYQFLQLADAARPGRVVYRIDDGGRPLGGKLHVVLGGRLLPGEENNLEVSAGPDPSLLAPVCRLVSSNFIAAPYWPWPQSAVASIDPGTNRVLYLQLEARVKNKNTAGNMRLDTVAVRRPWSRPSGHLAGELWTKGQRRTQRLWVQDRAVFERMLRDYQGLGSDAGVVNEAAGMAERGRYRAAGRLLAGASAEVLPARYAVRSHGKLGRYPVRVSLEDGAGVVLVDLQSVSADEIVWQLKAEGEQACTMTFEGLPSGAAYRLEENPGYRYRLVPAQGDATHRAGPDGTLSVLANVRPVDPERHELPVRLSGVYAGGSTNGILIDTQEPELWMDNPITVPVAKDAVRTRVDDLDGKAMGRDPRPMDRVDLVIDEHGLAHEVTARYGQDRGRIKVFHPPVMKGPVGNGVIELDNGRRYELGNRMPVFTKFEVDGLKPHYRNNPIGDLAKALVPGLELEIVYCPYTYNKRDPVAIMVKTCKEVERE